MRCTACTDMRTVAMAERRLRLGFASAGSSPVLRSAEGKSHVTRFHSPSANRGVPRPPMSFSTLAAPSWRR